MWWLKHTVNNADRIVSKIKAKFVRQEKYGIKIPRGPLEAYKLDQESGTDYWMKAMERNSRLSMLRLSLNHMEVHHQKVIK